MQIKLQTSVGAFDESFMRKLPLVEKAMIDHGLDPSIFAELRTTFRLYA